MEHDHHAFFRNISLHLEWLLFVEKFMELSSEKEKPLVNIGKDSTNSGHLVLNIKCKNIPSFNTFTKE